MDHEPILRNSMLRLLDSEASEANLATSVIAPSRLSAVGMREEMKWIVNQEFHHHLFSTILSAQGVSSSRQRHQYRSPSL